MALIHGTGALSEGFHLTIKSQYSYGLEDDRVAGLGGADTIVTGAGNDLLDGGSGNDDLCDGDGNDTVIGADGKDTVQVDAGNDVYYGGVDVDTLKFDRIHVGTAFDEDPYQGVRVDLSLTSPQNLGEFGIDLFFGFENVFGTYGNDTLLGTNGVNDLYGNEGNDILFGRGGNDEIDGYFGADTLVGGLGSDDIFLGGLGSPDSSRDVVRYESLKDSGVTAATRDSIFHFTKGQDKIDLSKLDANLSLKGNQAFKVVKGFTKAFGEVKLTYSAGHTVVQVDGDKDNAVDMKIVVYDVLLTKADFIL